MKALNIPLMAIFFLLAAVPVMSQNGILATQEDIEQLKKDLRSGEIEVGITREKKIRRSYGLPAKIDDAEKKSTYDYGEVKVVFNKIRYLRSWEYDSFKEPAYSDAIDDLRFDLESVEIVGDYWTAEQIRKDYDEPTDIIVTEKDGMMTVYWYGDIKLIFENVFTVRSWQAKDLNKIFDEGVLGSE